jgi:hypothetical protein
MDTVLTLGLIAVATASAVVTAFDTDIVSASDTLPWTHLLLALAQTQCLCQVLLPTGLNADVVVQVPCVEQVPCIAADLRHAGCGC